MAEEQKLMDELVRIGNAVNSHVRPSTRRELIQAGKEIFRVLAEKYGV